MKSKPLLFLIALPLIAEVVSAEEVTVAFGQHKPPYVHLDGGRGIEIDLFREALAHNGHTLRHKIMPKRKVKYSLKKYADVDAASSVNLSNDNFYYSDNFIVFSDVVVTKENISVETISDLKPYKVAAWQGASVSLGDEFTKLYGKHGTHKRKYREYPSQLNQNIAFWSGKVDVLIIDKHIFNYYRKMLSGEFNTSQSISLNSDLLPEETIHYAAFKDRSLRDQFNDALVAMRHDGIYQGIIDRHTK